MPEIVFPNLGIEIEKLNNVFLNLFGFNIYFYGVLIGIGVLLGLYYVVREAKATNQNVEDYYDLLFYLLIFCVIGARLYYVVFSWDTYKDNLLDIFNLRKGGLAVYGIVLAGGITAYIFSKKRQLNVWLVLDTLVPAVILGQALGRWGNFFNKEAFGGYTDGLFAMRLLANEASGASQAVLDKVITVGGATYIQVHPTFLYESIGALIIFILLNLFKRKKQADGLVFALYLMGYGILRAFIEGLRTDQLLLWGTSIAVSQVLSVVLVAFGLVLFYTLPKKNIQK